MLCTVKITETGLSVEIFLAHIIESFKRGWVLMLTQFPALGFMFLSLLGLFPYVGFVLRPVARGSFATEGLQ